MEGFNLIIRLRREPWGGREGAAAAKRLSVRLEQLSGFNSVLKSIMKATPQQERFDSAFDCLHI